MPSLLASSAWPARVRSHRCRDGSDGRPPEADPARPLVRRLYPDPGQRGTCEDVPGRKTDSPPPIWPADRLAARPGRASFVPRPPTEDMRALPRTRKQLVREQASHAQRIEKTLQDAILKLGSAPTEIMGNTKSR